MTSRRLARRVLTVLALLGALVPLTASTSYTVTIPQTLHALVPLGAGERAIGPMSVGGAARQAATVQGALPFAATHLGFQWDGSEDPPEVRTSPDGAAWSAWTPLAVSEDMSDHDAGRWVSELVPGDGARHVEVRDPHGRVVTVTDINVEDGPALTVTVRRGAEAATAGPRVVTRQEWGADEGLRKPGRTFHRVQKLFVHHTAGAATGDGAADVRAIYAYHTQTNGWDDIGYNFLIDPAGNLYEGRWARDYAGGEVHSGEDPGGRGVMGAHVGGFNAGTMGVSLIGNFQGAGPSAQATSTLVGFLAWKADRYGLDPLGAATYVNPSTGQKATFPNIAGHRDADATACPGQVLYDKLPDIRALVEARIARTSGASAPAMPTATVMHPGTASKDTTPAVSGAVSRTATRVEVVFEGTQASSRRVLSVAPSGGSFAGGDDDYDGLGLAEDRYSVRAVAYDAEGRGSPPAPVADDYVVSLEGLPSGYWVMGRDGGIFSYGSAGFHGSTGDRRLNAPPVGFDAAPDGNGYWLVAGDGGIFNYGSARFLGSTGNIRLAKPVVDMASTADGNGYWVVASDGGIFAFGNAPFHGSTGNIRLARPIVGMATTASGNGYWMVASDGGIFAFGDAGFHGSTGNIRLAKPIVGMAPTASGRGYWLAASDGGIFAFGDAAFLGSLPSTGVTATAVRMESANDSYYVLTEDGRVRSFGPAPLFGNPASLGVVAKDMAVAW
ncbi:MAG: N-acetylmuramoyl-L-alanine amidase [Actinomycetota bacterium]